MEIIEKLFGVFGIILFIIGVMGYGETIVEHIIGKEPENKIKIGYMYSAIFTIAGAILFYLK